MTTRGRWLQAISRTSPAPTASLRHSCSLLLCCVLTACLASGSDHQLLDRFFAASRLRDRTALARLATVVFEPARDGIVTDFSVLRTTTINTDQRQLTVRVTVRPFRGSPAERTVLVTTTRRAAAGLESATSPWVITALRQEP